MAKQQDQQHFGVFVKEVDGQKVTRLASSPSDAVNLEFNLGYARQTEATAKPEESPVDTPPAKAEPVKHDKASHTTTSK